MSGLRRALLALVALGGLFAAVDVVLILMSDHERDRAASAIFGPLIALGFIGTGAFAWWRRPRNRFGLLMVCVGYAWLLAGLTASNAPAVFTAASYLGPLYLALVVHMVLAFPSGALETVAQRAIVVTAYLDVLLVRLPFFLLGGEIGRDLPGRPPQNVAALTEQPDLADVFDYTAGFVGLLLAVAATVVLVRKRRSATAPQRSAQGPMLVAGLVTVGSLGLTFVLDLAGAGDTAVGAAALGNLVGFALLPYAFLVGLVRSRWSHAGAVGELIERLNEPDSHVNLADALADALGDRSLSLVFWRARAGHYVDPQGRRAELPPPGGDRAVTEVEREGRLVGAIIHDSQLVEERSLVRAAAAAAALQLDNERLEAELRARVTELQDSRERLVDVSMFERRRLERDLHDGAQQRLVALSVQLGLARRKLSEDPALSARLLDNAREELARALEELRELARGIHPAVLTDRGLGAALEALADRTPVPVDLAEMPADRLPPAVEAAAYFVVAESLTNVAKYAGAHHATVRVGREDGFAYVEVSDDGVGGADPAAGTGLQGLADRLAALDGRLEIHSPPGEGTVVRARIPATP